MRISFTEPLPEFLVEVDGFVVVGTCDDGVLAYDDERRPYKLTSDEDVPLDAGRVNMALVAAVDEASAKILGQASPGLMSVAFRMNKRSLQPDRLSKNGLPPRVLGRIGDLARRDDAAVFGHVLVLTSKLIEATGLDRASIERILPEVMDMQDEQTARAREARERWAARQAEREEDVEGLRAPGM